MANKIARILSMKCPRCGIGNLFEGKLFDIKKLGNMPQHCTQCNLSFKPEPGFYFGAAYVSYALGVVMAGLIYLILFLLGVKSIVIMLLIISAALLIFAPYNFRVSRAAWLAIFVREE